ncbi:MAG: hypothetical protein NT062_19875, partial [Proteobacteria bacterium]|nr:hypothetical protein [Pseudomonadota bacterium]
MAPAILGVLVSLTIHLYVWVRLVRRVELPRPWRAVATVTMLLLWISIPFTIASRLFAPAIARTFGWIAFTWLALVALVFVALLVTDIFHLGWYGKRRVRREPPHSPSRRVFLSRVTGGTALAVASSGVGSGMLSARG